LKKGGGPSDGRNVSGGKLRKNVRRKRTERGALCENELGILWEVEKLSTGRKDLGSHWRGGKRNENIRILF